MPRKETIKEVQAIEYLFRMSDSDDDNYRQYMQMQMKQMEEKLKKQRFKNQAIQDCFHEYGGTKGKESVKSKSIKKSMKGPLSSTSEFNQFQQHL